MPISSLVLRTGKGLADEVTGAVSQLPNTRTVRTLKDKVVVVTTTVSREEDRELWQRMEAIPGVVDVNLIYHNFEDLEGEVS